jgi:ketosteroid isomerase-like protein
MKKVLVIIATVEVLSVVLSVVCFSDALAGDSADIMTIRKIWDQYAYAVGTGDVDLWISLWDKNGVQMPPNQPALKGTDNIVVRRRKGAEAFNAQMEIRSEEIVVEGDMAFSRGTYTATLTPKAGGKAVTVDGKFLTILMRQADGSWKIYRDCFNSNVPPPK